MVNEAALDEALSEQKALRNRRVGEMRDPITAKTAIDAEQFKEDDLPKVSKDLTLMKPVGCEKCEGQGYSGRIAVHELMTNAPEIKRAIKQSLGVELITKLAMQQGMRSLRMDGI